MFEVTGSAHSRLTQAQGERKGGLTLCQLPNVEYLLTVTKKLRSLRQEVSS